jgi:hypothetical protein
LHSKGWTCNNNGNDNDGGDGGGEKKINVTGGNIFFF